MSVKLPFMWKLAQEDREWVSTLQDGPNGLPGHFDPYTGERVYIAIRPPVPGVKFAPRPFPGCPDCIKGHAL